MNMDRNTVSRSDDRGVYAATALASAKDEMQASAGARSAPTSLLL
jgi:hypothetical protein